MTPLHIFFRIGGVEFICKNLDILFIKRYVFCECKETLWNIRYMRASWNNLINFAQKCSCCGNHTTAACLVVERRLCSPVSIFTTAVHQMRGHWSTSFCGYSGCVVCRRFNGTTLREIVEQPMWLHFRQHHVRLQTVSESEWMTTLFFWGGIIDGGRLSCYQTENTG
jgi:hypothetical protein